jgi:type II secretory pathway pseudopilin PulG
LLELMVVLVIGSIMLTLGFTGLNKARKSGGSRGLATAVASELRLAREKAIAKGSPVAVVFPQGAGRSLFFIEGDTLPAVTRSVNYAGDYPSGTITVATYSGPSFEQNLSMPGSKSKSWEEGMDTWLPDAYKNDFVFMFIPNGSVVTNDLPAADGTYRVIVSMGVEVSPSGAPSGSGHVNGNDGVYYRLEAAGEPFTVAISESGAVESMPQLLGSSGGIPTLGAGDPEVVPPPHPEVSYTVKKPDLFFNRVTPPAEEVDGEMVHVINKGEYLTLEVFAHSEDGKPLYAGWTDDPVTKGTDPQYKGRFSVPGGELERMEFYPEYDVYEDGRPPVKDVWRSVWTWTPPSAAEAGDRYNLEVDVRDAKKQQVAQLPDVLPVDVAPPGEVVFERKGPSSGHWHLFTMWADGSRLTRLTDGPHDFRYASATADGKMVAFERDGNEVWVMNVDGTGQLKVADGQAPTISPTGDSIAYLRASPTATEPNRGYAYIKRLDSGPGATDQVQTFMGTAAGVGDSGDRVAYSANGRWLYFTAADGNSVAAVPINVSGVSGIHFGAAIDGAPVGNIASVPHVGGVFSGRHGQVYYHADHNDPYIGRYEAIDGSNGGGLTTISHRVSPGQNECFPAVSPNEDLLLFCEEVSGAYQIKSVPIAQWSNAGAGEPLTSDGQNLRPAWIHQSHPF